MIDVQGLRDAAANRAAQRPRLPFDGTVETARIRGVPVRRYTPSEPRRPNTVYFAHGGYGLFGTLDLQDGYCRALAQGLACDVVAVEYRLTPEHTFRGAVDDFSSVAGTVDGSPILAGDSAGGAIAVGAAAQLSHTAALLLTNPNLDLTLATFDDTAPDGPDLELSRYAFTAWARPTELIQAPRLHEPQDQLPDTFIAVGSLDALVDEARSLAKSLQQQGRKATLLELPDTGHGFMGAPGTARRVVDTMRAFLDECCP